jgi:acetyl esterase/lipase
MGHACAALTEAGYATWNVEYRRVGNRGGGWPGTFLDVAAAVDALAGPLVPPDLARRIDLTQVAALGHSAGGHLALWLAARPRLPPSSPLHAASPLPVRGVVSLAGVTSLLVAAEWGLSEGAAVSLLGGTPDAVPQRYKEASPDALLPLGVPQILLHGKDDEDVPYEMSERYVATALAAGDPAHLVSLPGGHFEPVDPETAQWEPVPEAISSILWLAGSLEEE